MAIDGTSGNDTLNGTTSADTINGLAGDDVIDGGSGNDTIDGGAGTDTAVFSGNLADYDFSYDSLSGAWTVEHLNGGFDGTDLVSNVENFQFADQTISTALLANPTVDLGIGDQSTDEDASFSFAIPSDAFADSDPLDELIYTATLANGNPLPTWLSFDGSSFTGTPLNDDVGVISILVTATDRGGQTVSSSYNITVNNTNDAPTVDTGIGVQGATEDAAYSFVVPATAFADQDIGDSLTYSATLVGGAALPGWLSFDGSTFSGTPLNGDVGSVSVEITATDGSGATVSTIFALDVSNTNDAPTVDAGIGVQGATEDAAYSFVVPTTAFADQDIGDSLTYSATLVGGAALPGWLSFDGTTFSGTPLNGDVGSVSVEITATDGSGATVSATFALDVSNTNDAPTVDLGIAAQGATEDIGFSYTLPSNVFDDVDLGDSLTLSAALANGDPLPSWLSFDGTTFSGTPLNDDGGIISVRVTATDLSSATVTTDFSLTVTNVNDAPEASDGALFVEANTAVSGEVSGLDEETPRSGLTFQLLSGPANGSITFNSDGSYSFNPDNDFIGVDNFTYRVTDPEGLTAEAQIDIEVFADAVGEIAETQVNTNTSSNQNYPSSTGLLNGGYVIAWSTYAGVGDTSGFGVAFQIYDTDGVKVGSEILANTYTSGNQDEVAVTALKSGGFAITWESAGHQDGDGDGIFGQLFSATGTKIGSEFQINSFTTNAQSDPAIVGLSDGGFIVTWESYIQTGDASSYGIFAQRYDASGVKSGSEFQVNTHTYLQQISATVTELANGNVIISWQSKNYDGHSYGISGQLYNSSGTKIGSEFVLNTYTTNGQTDPSISALESGGFVAAWVSSAQDGSGTGIFGQRFSETGAKVGSEFSVNTYTSGAQLNPSVAGLADGSFIVVWESNLQDGSSYGVFGQEFNANGNKIGSEFQVNEYVTDRQRYASVAALAGGGYVVSWTSYDDQDGSVSGTYSKTYEGGNGIVYDGTSGNDVINGSDIADTIVGLAGDDILKGGTGDDTLTGGDGADTYQFARGDGQDVIDDTSSDSSADTLTLSGVINHDQLWFEQSGDDLFISIIGESDQITVDDWYLSSNNKVEAIEASDGMSLDITGVQALVTAMATFATPGAGETDLSSSVYDDLQSDLTANWQA